MTGIVSEGRQIRPGSDPISKLGKIIKRPFANFTPKAIIRYFMYLPLNFIPVIGTVLFIILQGRNFGPSAHERYFQLKQMSSRQKEEFVEKRKAAYTRWVLKCQLGIFQSHWEHPYLLLHSFGIPAVLLELVPVAGVFFAFTNTVGAALWAADLEQHNTTAPGLRDQAKKVEWDAGFLHCLGAYSALSYWDWLFADTFAEGEVS